VAEIIAERRGIVKRLFLIRERQEGRESGNKKEQKADGEGLKTAIC